MPGLLRVPTVSLDKGRNYLPIKEELEKPLKDAGIMGWPFEATTSMYKNSNGTFASEFLSPKLPKIKKTDLIL